MPRRSKVAAASTETLNLRPVIVRAGLVLAILTALTAFAVRAGAQTMALLPQGLVRAPSAIATLVAAPSRAVVFAPAPFAVGEELTYKATFGGLPAGSARMRVDGIEMVRGRPAYHVLFSIDGGVPFYRVHDRYESWIDVQTLASLRHRQDISEGRYRRNTTYEIYPERATFQKDDEPAEASVANPLDDGSFIYAVRAARVRVGETRRDDRYFRPDRNPVVLTGLRQDTVSVQAGTFATTVVKPSIKANGLFSENGDAQIWFSDDASRIPVQVKTKFSRFSLTLSLVSATVGDASTHERLLASARDSHR
ncbi:MAG: DUF3108 domain-containing protein [Gemmatimonadaceae bacterium]